MTNPDGMAIGTFAELTGLAPSALRFYDDVDLLRPAFVDPKTSYRYYSDEQVAVATTLAKLRALGMPLEAVREVLVADPAQTRRIIDDRVAAVTAEAAAIRSAAEDLKAGLSSECGRQLGRASGPVLAAAFDQVLASTVIDPELPVLGAVHIETDGRLMTLTATDRYRLATRTLVLDQPAAASWTATVCGDDLRGAASWLRRRPAVQMIGELDALCFEAGQDIRRCRLFSGEFPDYRFMIEALGPPTSRATFATRDAVRAVDELRADRLRLVMHDGRSQLEDPNDGVLVRGIGGGDPCEVWFETVTLYPAISLAVGPDLLIELRGADQPATVRSADEGALTTIVMPVFNGEDER